MDYLTFQALRFMQRQLQVLQELVKLVVRNKLSYYTIEGHVDATHPALRNDNPRVTASLRVAVIHIFNL